MQALEFELLSSRDDLIEPSVLDRMVPPTLDEWTVAIETLKHRDVRQVSFDDYRRQQQLGAMNCARIQGFTYNQQVNSLASRTS